MEELQNGARRGKRLVLVPSPWQGHINPMLQLGSFLYSKGFSITVVHTEINSPNPSNHPEFTFFPISSDGLTLDVLSKPIVTLLALNANCKASLQECLVSRVMKQEPEKKITCIICDECLYFCTAVASNLGIPSMVLRTTSAANFYARMNVLALHSKGHVPFPDSMSLNPVPELYPLRYKDLPISPSGTFEQFLTVMTNTHDVKTSSAIICNTIDCLEQSSLAQIKKHCQVPIFSIGPLHKIANAAYSSLLEEDTGCIEWLDKQPDKSVVYVSLGSVASIGEKELAEMAWGLADSKQSFLWVIRPGSISGSDWIELLPEGFRDDVGERGLIVKWATQREVLAHRAVGGFWTHCGWNSTLESISEGVPMICKPCFSDQKVQARYVSKVWRIGVELEDEFERGDIERAVRKIMVNSDGKDIRVRAREMKEKIEVSMSNGGFHYNSLNELVQLIMAL